MTIEMDLELYTYFSLNQIFNYFCRAQRKIMAVISKRKKFFFFLVMLSVLLTHVDGQSWKYRRTEIMFGAGTSYLSSDVGAMENDRARLQDLLQVNTNMNFSFGARYRLTRRLNARANITLGTFRADDSKGYYTNRNYACTVYITEPILVGEYYFLRSTKESSYLIKNRRRATQNKFLRVFDLYGYAGVGMLSYAVDANDALKPNLLTDAGKTLVLPAGLGASFYINPGVNLGAELGMRHSFSDKLDGFISETSNKKDNYYFLNLTLAVKIWKVPSLHFGWLFN